MTHPIDPLTPEALTARILWDTAKEGNIIRFLGVWERMIAGHAKEVEDAYGEGMNNLGKYDDGYEIGYQDGMDRGMERGYAQAQKEQDEQASTSSSE